MSKKTRTSKNWEHIARRHFLFPQVIKTAREEGSMMALFQDAIDKRYSLYLVKKAKEPGCDTHYHQRLLQVGKIPGRQRSDFVKIGKVCSSILNIPWVEVPLRSQEELAKEKDRQTWVKTAPKPSHYFFKLEKMSRPELLELIDILGGTYGYFLKKGIPVYKPERQLREEVRKRCRRKNCPKRIAKAGHWLANFQVKLDRDVEAYKIAKQEYERELQRRKPTLRQYAKIIEEYYEQKKISAKDWAHSHNIAIAKSKSGKTLKKDWLKQLEAQGFSYPSRPAYPFPDKLKKPNPPQKPPREELEYLINNVRIAALEVDPSFLYDRVLDWLSKERDIERSDTRLDWFGIEIVINRGKIIELNQKLSSEEFSQQLSESSPISFYRNFIKTAKNCKEIKGKRPGDFPHAEPGFDFLEALADWLKSQN